MLDATAPAGAPAAPAGSAYLLCFGEPGLHVTDSRYAKHYIGHVTEPLDLHHGATLTAAVTDAVPVLRAARAAGLEITLVRVWPGVDAAYAARLRAGKRSPRLCPSCRERAAQAAR